MDWRDTFAESGYYEFRTRTDDGVRLWLDGQLVIDQWRLQGPTTYTESLWLDTGAHSVRVEHFENTGGAVAQVSWTLAEQPV